MKVIIPSRNRSETISTHKLLPEAIILVDDEQQRQDYLKNPTINPASLTVVNNTQSVNGKAFALNWAMDNLLEAGEWVIFADDNIREFQAVHPDYYDNEVQDFKSGTGWHKIYTHPCTADEIIHIALKMKIEAQERGLKFAGCCQVRNYFFRSRKWRDIGICLNKFSVQQDWGYRYPLNRPETKAEDFLLTAVNLLEFGGVLINNYVYTDRGFDEPGGHGTLPERWAAMSAGYEALEQFYPGLWKRTVPPNFPADGPYYNIDIAIHSRSSLERWRTAMGKVSWD